MMMVSAEAASQAQICSTLSGTAGQDNPESLHYRKRVTFVLVLATPARLSRWHALYGLLLPACLAASALHTTTMAPYTPSVADFLTGMQLTR